MYIDHDVSVNQPASLSMIRQRFVPESGVALSVQTESPFFGFACVNDGNNQAPPTGKATLARLEIYPYMFELHLVSRGFFLLFACANIDLSSLSICEVTLVEGACCSPGGANSVLVMVTN